MRTETRRNHTIAAITLCLVLLCPYAGGCAAGALVLMSVAGGAAAISGEPQRLYATQGQDFDEQRASMIHSGVHTPADVVGIMGYPQTKTFTASGEEWSYRYYVPPSMLRSGTEKILTVRFQEGKVSDVRYTLSAL